MAYTIPTRPTAQGGTIPFLGPYAQNQAAAEQAWEAAQANLAAQRGQMLQAYGFRPTANGMEVDPTNPYGQYQQTLLANQQGSQAAEQAMVNRGFQGSGPGFAAQAPELAQQAAGARNFQLATNMSQAEETQQEALAAAQAQFANQTAMNQYDSVQYAINHNIFTPAAAQLSDAEVKRRVAAMQAAWSARYGGPNAKNKAGLTFQQRLNKLGAAKIYNPTATFQVGRKVFH